MDNNEMICADKSLGFITEKVETFGGRKGTLADFLKDPPEPRRVVVVTEGGIVQDVVGLRKGDEYEVVDWDELEDTDPGARSEAELQAIINGAAAQK